MPRASSLSAMARSDAPEGRWLGRHVASRRCAPSPRCFLLIRLTIANNDGEGHLVSPSAQDTLCRRTLREVHPACLLLRGKRRRHLRRRQGSSVGSASRGSAAGPIPAAASVSPVVPLGTLGGVQVSHCVQKGLPGRGESACSWVGFAKARTPDRNRGLASCVDGSMSLRTKEVADVILGHLAGCWVRAHRAGPRCTPRRRPQHRPARGRRAGRQHAAARASTQWWLQRLGLHQPSWRL